MPNATVSTESQHFDLSSCPGGWIDLKRMTHGQRLHRQDIAMSMSMTADTKHKTATMGVTPTQTRVAQYEFKTCVVDHNLEDDQGHKLNFNNPSDVERLDGRIGEEISELIDTMHNWESDLPNSVVKSDVVSSELVSPAKS